MPFETRSKLNRPQQQWPAASDTTFLEWRHGELIGYIEAVKRHDDPLPIEIEIRGEIARALGRAARAFEHELEPLRAFEDRLSAASVAERVVLSSEYQAMRRRVARRLWFLIVHREALGLRRHESLYELYQIPPSLVPNP